MRKMLALLSLGLGISLAEFAGFVWAGVPIIPPPALPNNSQPIPLPVPSVPPSSPPLQAIALGTNCTPRKQCLGWDEQIWGESGKRGDREALLAAIDNSLRFLGTDKAIAAYQNYPIPEISLDRVRRSLQRFRQLVISCKSPAQLQAAVRREFIFYKSVGNDGKGTVKFTAYYEPVHPASRVRTSVYKYPIYRLPTDFERWAKPHPKRIDLEGKDGLLGDKSPLHGLELFWLRDRLDAYLIHIQGSAQLQLTDGTRTSVSYAGGTDYPWTSIGKELAKDGKLPLEGLTLPKVIQYFRRHPQELNNYLPRWERFVFFQETHGSSASGSIGVPVTPERSIATDKSIMPPGALAVINAVFPYPVKKGKLAFRRVSRFVLDQDTGSAIKGPGRVDYFMGTGQLAGARAGITGGNGSLYYLLLKE